MSDPSAVPAVPGPDLKRRRQPSVAWQLALAQEFGRCYPFEWDARTGEVVASAALKALFAVVPGAELRGPAVIERVDPAYRETLARRAGEALRAGGAFEAEFRATLPDGISRWILARGRALERGARGRIAGVAIDITRRKQAELALAEKEAALLASETRFRAIQETSIDGFMMLESVRDAGGDIVDFRWVYANEASERIVGRPRAWFIGRRLLVEMPGNREAGLFDAYRQVVATGEPWSQEFSYNHEGLAVYLRAVAARAGDGLAVTFADLSERRRAEEKLIAAEERWRAILNTMPQMVWSARPDGTHDFFNDRWYEFTGVARGATDGEGWTGMFHPEDTPAARERWARSLETGQTYQVEYRLRHHTGRWRWALGRAVALRGGDGSIERWFGTCTDIDDLKAAEARLQASEERLRLALDAAEVVGTWDWDVEADRFVADARFARLYGVDPEVARDGAPLGLFVSGIHPEDRPAVEEAIGRALATGERYSQEYRLRRPDGSVAWISARGQCEQRDGRPVRFPGAAFDITERKTVEEARELLAHELAHRIKNIFAVVNSIVTLSARSYPEARPFAEAIRARLTALGRAHDYVRPHGPDSRLLEEGETESRTESQTAHGLFAALLAPYREEADGRIVVDGCDRPVGVRAATALALVIHELATNAVKYGGLSVDGGTVRLGCTTDGAAYRIVWRERGGPEVEGAPSRRGFGTLMSERTASAQLKARVEHDWDTAGLTVTLTLPTAELAR